MRLAGVPGGGFQLWQAESGGHEAARRWSGTRSSVTTVGLMAGSRLEGLPVQSNGNSARRTSTMASRWVVMGRNPPIITCSWLSKRRTSLEDTWPWTQVLPCLIFA